MLDKEASFYLIVLSPLISIQMLRHLKRTLNTGVIISIKFQGFTQSISASDNVNNIPFKSSKHELCATQV